MSLRSHVRLRGVSCHSLKKSIASEDLPERQKKGTLANHSSCGAPEWNHACRGDAFLRLPTLECLGRTAEPQALHTNPAHGQSDCPLPGLHPECPTRCCLELGVFPRSRIWTSMWTSSSFLFRGSDALRSYSCRGLEDGDLQSRTLSCSVRFGALAGLSAFSWMMLSCTVASTGFHE